MAYFPRWDYGDDYTEWNYPTGVELAEYLKEELVGKKITYMDDTLIELDNGRVLEIAPNEGCDCCPNGNASIVGDSVRAASESAILDVKYSEWETHGESSSFGIFILTANKHESNLYDTVSISGYDAFDVPSYYGTGFWVRAAFKEGMKPTEADVAESSNVGGNNAAGKRELPGAMGYMSNPPIIRPKKRKGKPSGTLKLRGDIFKQ
jgi:hypothetical protein